MMNFYTFSDCRSAKSCIKIEQKPETVQYIENNAARMGVSVQTVVDAIITAQYNSIKYRERAEKSPIDRKTYELRKQLELAQYRPTDEVINWNGYSFKAGEAANILKRMNGEFTKPSKKQLLLFENEIAADAAPVAEPMEETTTDLVAEVEKVEEVATVTDAEPMEEETPAEPLPGWCKNNTKVLNTLYNSIGTIKDFTYNKVLEYWQCTFVNTATGTEYKKHSISYMKPIEEAPAATVTDAIGEIVTNPTAFKTGESVILAADVLGKSHNAVKSTVIGYSFSEKIGAVIYNLKGEDGNIYAGTESDLIAAPAEQKPAPTDAELIETAARIRANYEAMNAEAEPPAPVTYTEEQVQRMVADAVAAALYEEKAKRRKGRISRLSRLLHPVRWVALAFVACVLVGLLTGANRRTAEAAPDDIAAVIHLRPVTITAKAPQTINNTPQTPHIEENSPDIEPVKNLAAAEPASQKPAPDDLNTAPDADGLTVCAGTPWAYTMMNWV